MEEYLHFDRLLAISGSSHSVLNTMTCGKLQLRHDGTEAILLEDPSGNIVEVDRSDEFLDESKNISLFRISERLKLAAPCGKVSRKPL